MDVSFLASWLISAICQIYYFLDGQIFSFPSVCVDSFEIPCHYCVDVSILIDLFFGMMDDWINLLDWLCIDPFPWLMQIVSSIYSLISVILLHVPSFDFLRYEFSLHYSKYHKLTFIWLRGYPPLFLKKRLVIIYCTMSFFPLII